MSMEIDRNHLNLGPIWLTEGVSKGNCYSLFWGCFVTIGILSIISASTSFVMNETLKIPLDQQGSLSGWLVVLTEITQIILFGIVGVLADRIGRRPVYAFGLVGMGLGYLFYPYATDTFDLSIYRIIYACGLAASTGMLGTVVTDYPQEATRGKMVAAAGMLNGLGVVLLTGVFGFMLNAFAQGGTETVQAGRITHAILAIFAGFSAFVVGFGLKKGTPHKSHEEKPSYQQLARAGFAQARNPRIALSYASAFVARSDLVILGTFTILWGTKAGVLQGLDSARATFEGTMIFVTAQTAALAWAPVVGIIMDRTNRVTGLAICMFMAAIGFLSMFLVGDPIAPESKKYFVLLGMGQISAFFGATTLIGQEAPRRERGAVIGMFNVMGAIGILISAYVGGQMFDSIDPSAPFILIGVLNSCLFIAAMIVRKIAPGPMPEKNFDALISRVKGVFQSPT